MMRKDVRIGFAIGGVLLAVLVVYALVGTGGGNGAKNGKGAELVTEDTTGRGAGSAASAGSTDSALARTDRDKLAGGSSLSNTPTNPPSSPLSAYDPNKPSSALPSVIKVPADMKRQPGASESAQADTVEKTGGAGSVASKNGANSDANEDIWGKALSTGQLMLTQTPTPAGDAPPVRATDSGGDSTASSTDPLRGNTNDPSNRNPSTRPSDSESSISANRPSSVAGSSAASGIDTATDASPRRIAARTHTVTRGETLSSISQMIYGSPKHVELIKKANPTLVPEKMRPGMTINLPELVESRRTTPGDRGTSTGHDSSVTGKSHDPQAYDPKTQYRVEANDSLYKIALKLYGRVEMMDKLYEFNKDTIGPDRAKLKLNMLLKLPEPPTQTALR